MIWMQGESDTGDPAFANEYESNLTNFIKDVRAEVKKPNMPFVLATISEFDAWKAYGDVVRAAEATVAKNVPHCATFLTNDYGASDPWHYDTPGMVSLGQRFAKAMKGTREVTAGNGALTAGNTLGREIRSRPIMMSFPPAHLGSIQHLHRERSPFAVGVSLEERGKCGLRL